MKLRMALACFHILIPVIIGNKKKVRLISSICFHHVWKSSILKSPIPDLTRRVLKSRAKSLSWIWSMRLTRLLVILCKLQFRMYKSLFTGLRGHICLLHWLCGGSLPIKNSKLICSTQCNKVLSPIRIFGWTRSPPNSARESTRRYWTNNSTTFWFHNIMRKFKSTN